MNPLQFLPKALDDIIVDYKNQMEHQEKFKSSLEKIKDIGYCIYDGMSTLLLSKEKTVRYHYDTGLVNELWFHILGDSYKEIIIVEDPLDNKVAIEYS